VVVVRRLVVPVVGIGVVALAACSSPTAESEAPSVTAVPSTTELIDLADPDPLPFPGHEVDRVTIAPLPGLDVDAGTVPPELTGWAAFDYEIARSVLNGGSDAVAVAVSIGGEVVHEAAFGARIPNTLDVVQPTDRFRIASISKPITAITALQLVEDGVVGLDEPIGDLVAAQVGLGAAHPGAAGVTVRQLLTHTSGFAKSESLFFRNQVGSCEEAATVALGRSAAGGGFQYSNMNYCVLGLLIEQLTGQSYEAAVYERLLTPLGISGMRLAPTYDPGPGEVEHRSVPGRNYMEVLGAAGAWVAKPGDLVRIFDSLDHSTPGWKPLEPATVDLMRRSGTNPSSDRGYGLGVILYGGGVFGHTGTIESTHAMVVDRPDDVTWAVTVSGENPSDTPRIAGIVDRAFAAGGFVAG
jgi:D-alanyl-D-alanine carboxypeptidase